MPNSGDPAVRLHEWLAAADPEQLCSDPTGTLASLGEEALALLVQYAQQGLWATQVMQCEELNEQPYDFGQCLTHDRTFPLGESCDHQGKSLVDYLEHSLMAQRARAVKAEMNAEFDLWSLKSRLSASAGRNIDLRARIRVLEAALQERDAGV